MSHNIRRVSSSEFQLKQQFRYLQHITEEDFQLQDEAERRRDERDVEIGTKSRESVERDRTWTAQHKSWIDGLRKHKLEGDKRLEGLVDSAICRICKGLTIAVAWQTKIVAPLCDCPTSSEDEAALPSPPRTPSRTSGGHEEFDGKLDVGQRQWMKERALMELRGPYVREFEDYAYWREARIKFDQISTEPARDAASKTSADPYELIRGRICRLER